MLDQLAGILSQFPICSCQNEKETTQMNNWIYWLIGLMIVSALINVFTPKIKGWMGEATVAGILSSLLSEEYRVLNNVMLHTDRGTTQVDHIVVSVYGIFVIETKNYKGWITGTENSEQWTKNMYGKKYSFRNPIRQNFAHVKALEQLLEFPEDMFIPIVVFSVNSELKVKTKHLVVYTVKLKKTILSFKDKKLAPEQLDQIVQIIKNANVDSKENRKTHVENLHRNISDMEHSVKNGICPKCGGTLVKRKGKYGEFVGCSNYPKCRYTMK